MIILIQEPAPLPPEPEARSPKPPLKASYAWGYVGPEGEGQGTLNILVDLATGRVVLELHGLGERLLLLDGDRANGYRLQIPREKLDTRAPGLAGFDLPFLPRIGTPEALLALLEQGQAPGTTVTKRDAQGPVKLHYKGKDPKGRPEEVWLKRKVWVRTPPTH